MNVTLVSGRSPVEYTGGIETHVKEISKRLAFQGIAVKALSTSSHRKHPYKLIIGDVEFEIYPAWAPFETYYFSVPLYKALKAEKSPIMHVHGFQSFAILAALLNKKPEQKMLVTLHSGRAATRPALFVDRYYRALIKRLLNKADRIIGVSRFDLELFGFDPFCPKDAAKTVIIPNGVDFSEFAARQELPYAVKSNSRFILSVGRLEKYKGHDYAIESFAKLKSLNSKNHDVKLIIVGSGRHKEKLQELSRRLHVREDVLILSNLKRKELIGLYQKCELFILLSHYESHGISVAEAIAAGKPTIVSSISALRYFVQESWSIGVPFPPNTVAVAKLMNEILDNPAHFAPKNPKLKSWDDVVCKIRELYEEAPE